MYLLKSMESVWLFPHLTVCHNLWWCLLHFMRPLTGGTTQADQKRHLVLLGLPMWGQYLVPTVLFANFCPLYMIFDLTSAAVVLCLLYHPDMASW